MIYLGSTLIIAKSYNEPKSIFGGMALDSWQFQESDNEFIKDHIG